MRSPLPCYGLATSLDTPAVWLSGVECYRLPKRPAKGQKRSCRFWPTAVCVSIDPLAWTPGALPSCEKLQRAGESSR
jgi:hypothetical protein